MIVAIMAGGLGKRMNSTKPKVLHSVFNTNGAFLPMIIHVINTAIQLNPDKILIIVGQYFDIIRHEIDIYITPQNIEKYIQYVHQDYPSGTGDAIKSCLPFLLSNSKCLILSGDVPLISLETLNSLIQSNNTILITELNNPSGCGRIMFSNQGDICKIIEEKDCSSEEKKIKFVNCGIYSIYTNDLHQYIPLINNSNKNNEYYLTDIVDLLVIDHQIIKPVILDVENQYSIKNVNTSEDLMELNNYILSMIEK